MQYETTNTFKKLATAIEEGNSTIIMRGGQGSSKTTSILMYFILVCVSKMQGLEMSIVSDTLPNLKKGPIKEFEKILKSMGYWNQFTVNKTDRIYKHKKSGNYIEFFSVENEGSALGARRSHLYINEANKIDFETYDALSGRSEFVVIDFNPTARFWADDILDFPNTKVVVSTFLDNHKIPEKESTKLLWYKSKAYHNPDLPTDKIDKKENIKSKFYLNKWRVLGLGAYGALEGLIFTEFEDWDTIDMLPKEATYIGAGLDFGFSHVSAITKLYRYDDSIILKQHLFKEGLTASKLGKIMLRDLELQSSLIGADESRPEMIEELQTMGLPVIGVRKGPGSVDFGLDLMHSYNLLLTSDSEDMLREFRAYPWATDKNGKSLGVPDKAKDVDNSIDAARYAFMQFLSQSANSRRFCLTRIA